MYVIWNVSCIYNAQKGVVYHLPLQLRFWSFVYNKFMRGITNYAMLIISVNNFQVPKKITVYNFVWRGILVYRILHLNLFCNTQNNVIVLLSEDVNVR